MHLDEFEHRFTLNTLLADTIATPKHFSKRAAVLVPIVQRKHGATILLTQRAFHLRHHPGQISFPGGRIETSDATPVAAALRETQEEIGIPASKIRVIGSMNHYPTTSQYIVQPIVASVDPQYSLHVDDQEVHDVFEVPLAFLLNDNNRYEFQVPYKKRKVTIHAMPYKGHFIWGATARMLHDLILQIKP